VACCPRPGAATLGLVARVRALYARFRNLIHEGARFGVVGFVGLVVTEGVTNLLRYQAGLDRLSSFAIASVIATGITFIGSRYWTYRHRERSGMRREAAVFFAVNGIGVAISEVPVGLTYPLHLNGGLSYNVALIGGIGLATLFRFWSYQRWVWPAQAGAPAGGCRRHRLACVVRARRGRCGLGAACRADAGGWLPRSQGSALSGAARGWCLVSPSACCACRLARGRWLRARPPSWWGRWCPSLAIVSGRSGTVRAPRWPVKAFSIWC